MVNEVVAPPAPSAEDFREFARTAAENAKSNPHGISVGAELEIEEDSADAVHSLWGSPDAKVSLHTWVATPDEYPVDGTTRPDFTEVTSLMTGWCTVIEEGQEPVEMRAGDTYVLQPGWTGTWIVRERAIKACVYIYD